MTKSEKDAEFIEKIKTITFGTNTAPPKLFAVTPFVGVLTRPVKLDKPESDERAFSA